MGLKNLPAQVSCKTWPSELQLWNPSSQANWETFQTWIAAGGLYIQVQIQVQKPQSSRNAGTPTAMQLWDALLSQGYKSHTSQPELSILNQFQSPSLQPQVLTLNPADAVLQGPVARKYRMSEYRTSVCRTSVCPTNAVGLLPAVP